jgi:hypothetical protein
LNLCGKIVQILSVAQELKNTTLPTIDVGDFCFIQQLS